jgi:UDP-glucose 4-epimerase
VGHIAGKRVLVTGSSGFIGGHLARALAGENEVCGLDFAAPREPSAGVAFVQHDLADDLAAAGLPDRIDYVFHCGAFLHRCEVEPGRAFAVNVHGTHRLLEYARGASATTFLYTNTGSVYSRGDQPLREEDPIRPTHMYGLTKYLAEQAVLFYGRHFNAISVRYFYPYGPGTSNPYQASLDKIRRGETVDVPAGGKPRVNPIHISDVVEATLRAATLTGQQVINIGGREVVDQVGLMRLWARLLGQELPLREVPDTRGGDFVASTIRMQGLLDFTPRVSLEEGMRRWLVEDRA